MRIIFFNALFVLVGVVILEIIFGTWIKGPDFGAMPLQKNLTLYFSVEDSYHGYRFVTNSRDSYALRGDYPSPERIDILTIGGSTTAELFVDDRETWSHLLGEKLTSISNTQTYVANAGVDGQSTVGHLWSFENWFPKIPGLSPKLVIVYVGLTDTLIGGDEDATWLPFPIRHLGNDAYLEAKQFVKNHSALFHLYRVIKGAVKAKIHDASHSDIDYKNASWGPWGKDPYRQDCEEDQYQAYGSRLDKVVQNIRALKAEPVLITQIYGSVRKRGGEIRYLGGDGIKPALVTLECINKTTIDYCETKRLSCFDLANEISFEVGDHYDTTHTTPQGSERIATAIADWILDDRGLVASLGIVTNTDTKVSP